MIAAPGGNRAPSGVEHERHFDLQENHAMILAGDIGGTKTVIAHYEESGGKPR
jgi:hypothetical protein